MVSGLAGGGGGGGGRGCFTAITLRNTDYHGEGKYGLEDRSKIRWLKAAVWFYTRDKLKKCQVTGKKYQN